MFDLKNRSFSFMFPEIARRTFDAGVEIIYNINNSTAI